MSNIGQIIRANMEDLYKLQRAGVKSINTALDYISIADTYEAYSWIKDKEERKEVTASRCRVSVRTVHAALTALAQPVAENKKSST